MKYFLKSLIIFLIVLIMIDYSLTAVPTDKKESKSKKVVKPKKVKPKKKKTKKNGRCLTLKTKWNVSGWKDNELKYFSRHLVKCPNDRLLTFVKLQLDKKLTHEESKTAEVTRMRFKFTCCKTRVYSCKWFRSKPVKSGNAYKLNKIIPKCKCNKVLRAFRFVTKFKQPGDKDPKTHAKYQCCSFHYSRLKKYKKEKLSTPWNDSGNGRTKFLSRHNIRCQKRSFISKFRLILQDKNLKSNPSTRFDYTCIHPVYKKGGIKKGGKVRKYQPQSPAELVKPKKTVTKSVPRKFVGGPSGPFPPGPNGPFPPGPSSNGGPNDGPSEEYPPGPSGPYGGGPGRKIK